MPPKSDPTPNKILSYKNLRIVAPLIIILFIIGLQIIRGIPSTSPAKDNNERPYRTFNTDKAPKQVTPTQTAAPTPQFTPSYTPERTTSQQYDWFETNTKTGEYEISGMIGVPQAFKFSIIENPSQLLMLKNQTGKYIKITFNSYEKDSPDIKRIQSSCKETSNMYFNYVCNNTFYLIFDDANILNLLEYSHIPVIKIQTNLSYEEASSIKLQILLSKTQNKTFKTFDGILAYLRSRFDGITIPNYKFVTPVDSCELGTTLEVANPKSKGFTRSFLQHDYSSISLHCPGMEINTQTSGSPKTKAIFSFMAGWQGGDSVFPACNGYPKCKETTLDRGSYLVRLIGPTQEQEYSVTMQMPIKIKSLGIPLDNAVLGFISKDLRLIENTQIW